MPESKSLTVGDHHELIREIAADPHVQQILRLNSEEEDYKKRMSDYVESGVCHGLSVYWLKLVVANSGDAEKASDQMRNDLPTPGLLKFLVSFVIRFIKNSLQGKSNYFTVFSYQNNIDRLGKGKQSSLALKALNAKHVFSLLSEFLSNDDLAVENLAALISKLPINEPCIIAGRDHATGYYKNAQGETFWYDPNAGEVLKTNALTIAEGMMRYGPSIELTVHRESALDPFSGVRRDYNFCDAEGLVSKEKVEFASHSDDTTVQKKFVTYFLQETLNQPENTPDISPLLQIVSDNPHCGVVLLEWLKASSGQLKKSVVDELDDAVYLVVHQQVCSGNSEFFTQNADLLKDFDIAVIIVGILKVALSEIPGGEGISLPITCTHLCSNLISEEIELGIFIRNLVDFRKEVLEISRSLDTLSTDKGAKAFIRKFCEDRKIPLSPSIEVFTHEGLALPQIVVTSTPVSSGNFNTQDLGTGKAPKQSQSPDASQSRNNDRKPR